METDPASGPGRPAAGGDTEDTPVPWHFKLLLVALVLYLGYRLVQLIVWLAGKAF